MRYGIIAAGAMMMFSAPTMAQEAASAKPPKKICRYDIATGSMIPGHKICRTAAEWSAKHKENEVGTDAFIHRGHGAFTKVPGTD